MSQLLVVTLAREAGTDRAGVVLRTMDQALELVLMIPQRRPGLLTARHGTWHNRERDRTLVLAV